MLPVSNTTPNALFMRQLPPPLSTWWKIFEWFEYYEKCGLLTKTPEEERKRWRLRLEEKLTKPIWKMVTNRGIIWHVMIGFCGIVVGDKWITLPTWIYSEHRRQLIEAILKYVPLWYQAYCIPTQETMGNDPTFTVFFPTYRVQTQFVEWLRPQAVVYDRYTMKNKIVEYLFTKKQVSRDVALYICSFLTFVN